MNFLTLPDAPCRGATHLFFPNKGDFMSATRAKRLCATCPQVDPCLQYALDNYEDYGVWGGTTEKNRRHIRRLQLTTKGRAA